VNNGKSQVEEYLAPDRITDRLKGLSPGAAVTHAGLEVVCDGYLQDNEWGVFDLSHRVYVHNTYDNFVPLVSSRDVSILITCWNRLPVFFQVMTARLEPGLYYQSFSVLGILYCHQMSRMVQEGEKTRVKIDWYIVSHRFFKFLHYLFNRRLAKLQKVQNGEDAPLRERRLALRKRGITFTTDVPDFINANDLGDHVILPSQVWPQHARAPKLGDKETCSVEMGPIELLLRRDGDDLLVWPALCPHEGAKMDEGHLCGDQLSCPWHGRKYRAARLKSSGEGMLRYLGLCITLQNGELVAIPDAR
jgi:Rieske [2Fe-2S] domain